MINRSPLPTALCSHVVNSSRAFLSQTSLPYAKSSLAISSLLLRHGFISSVTLGTPTHPSPTDFVSSPVSAKRIWLGLKHRNGQPVLRRMNLVSKPSVRVSMSKDELGRILRGNRAKNVSGVGMGEIIVVRTLDGHVEEYKEGWEAFRAGQGGEIVCRVA